MITLLKPYGTTPSNNEQLTVWLLKASMCQGILCGGKWVRDFECDRPIVFPITSVDRDSNVENESCLEGSD